MDKRKPLGVNFSALLRGVSRLSDSFAVFRELLQNADDHGAKNFVIDFQTGVDTRASNRTKPDLDSVKVVKWLVKNDGASFTKEDRERLTKIADGNPDEQKIGAFGLGFYSVFSVTDQPIVKSGGETITMFCDGFYDPGKCEKNKWTVIEMNLKRESPIPQTLELTRFLVTSMTFLVNIRCVTISLDDRILFTVTKSSRKLDKKNVPNGMVGKSPDGTMSIDFVELILQEINVVYVGDPPANMPIAQTDLEGNERDPMGSPASVSKTGEEVTPGGVARLAGAHSGVPSVKAPQLSTEYYIYSANVKLTPGAFEKSLESAIKKLPKDFSLQMAFFSKGEHDKLTQKDNNSGFESVFCGPQGLCPRLQGEHPARIFIGQSTTQTTGMACHMSGRFIPTMERVSIDLSSDVAITKWNKELLYVGGILARMVYDSEMNKVHNAWPTQGKTDAAKELALYTIRSLTVHSSTPNSMVSDTIKKAFFDCSNTDFLILSDRGIRHTKEIRHFRAELAQFMQTAPVLPETLKKEMAPMINVLPEKLLVKTYSLNDILNELKQRCLTDVEMAAFLRWWADEFQRQGNSATNKPQDKEGFKRRMLEVGKAVSGNKEIELSVIKTFVPRQMLNDLKSDDPLPGDTIPLALIQGLVDSDKIKNALGWKELPVAHWLRYLKDPASELDQVHDIRRAPTFALRMLTVLNTLWPGLQGDSHSEVQAILEDVACIPTTSLGKIRLVKPEEAYFPEADVFRDLPVVQEPLRGMARMLGDLGVRKRCDIEDFVKKVMTIDQWNAVDLARYLESHPDASRRVMKLDIFLCSDDKRHHITKAFAPTDVNQQLGLPVINSKDWDPSSPGAKFLVEQGLQGYPKMEELIPIALSASDSIRHIVFKQLCGPLYEAALKKDFDPSMFPSCAFISGVRNGKTCYMSHEEVFSDPDWALLGFGKLPDELDKNIVSRLKIQAHPTVEKLFQVLELNPPKDTQTATEWLNFLDRKGGFIRVQDFEKFRDLKIIPVPKLASEQQEPDYVSLRGCCLKSKSDPEDPFYQQLFKFVDFGDKANGFLKCCGVKERPELIDILEVLLNSPQRFYEMAGTERYLVELRMIALGYKPLKVPSEKMSKAPIFLGRRQRKGDEYKLYKAEEVLIADDMESCRRFGEYITIVPRVGLPEKFYSEMGVKLLSSRIKCTVKPSTEYLNSPIADELQKSIVEKIHIFLDEIEEHRFKDGMRLLRWDDKTKFLVQTRGCLRVTKRLESEPATELGGPEPYDTEVRAETELKEDGANVLWIEHKKSDRYDIAVALCRLILSTYDKNDVQSLMTILNTPIEDLENRGYNVKRTLEGENNLSKGGHSGMNPNGSEVPTAPSPPNQRSASSMTGKLKKWKRKWLGLLHKDSKLGVVKPSDIETSLGRVRDVMREPGGKDSMYISSQEKADVGKQLKDVLYCDERLIVELEYVKEMGRIKVWKLIGAPDIPRDECRAFVEIISDLADVSEVNQTRCHVFYHPSNSDLMGFNRKNEIFFGLGHYIQKHQKVSGKAYIDWYYIMAHEMAHTHTPYHDEYHELMFAELATEHLAKLHNLPAMQEMFKCQRRS